MYNFEKTVKDIHDFECPHCGVKPSFRITGENSYITDFTCLHSEEVNEEVDKRFKEHVSRLKSPNQRVRLK